jgi:hypothetical protein
MPEINGHDVYSGTGKEEILYDGTDIVAPTNVIPNAFSAKVVYERMRKSHVKRAFTYARIQGMIDGNPPYPKKTIQRAGLHTMSNVNWRDAEAIYESVALAYWSLFNDVEHIAQFTTDIGDPNSNPVTGDIVSEEWNKVVRSWDKFSALMSQHQGDLIKFGVSFIVWPDERDWRFDVADVWTTLVPERSRNNTDMLGIVAIEHVMSAQELWDVYENSKSEKWNKEVLGRILVHTANFKDKQQYSSQYVAELQRKIRNGDLCMDEIYNDDILMVSLFIREFDGEISRGIFHPTLDGEQIGDWAFFSDRHYQKMGEALQLFTFTPGEKFVHGNKGIGHRIFNPVEGMTQIDNSVMDSVRRSATVLVQTRTGRNRDVKQIQFNYGGITDIGEANFVQNLMGANLAPSVEVARYFRFKMETNNNIAGAFMSNPDGKPRTLGETQIQATKEARVQKNRIAHYYEQLDVLFRSIVQKMLKAKETDPGYDLVKLWKDRCIEKGVPEDFFVLTEENEGQNGLPEHMTVRAVRASGSGSQIADQVEMQTVMQVLPTLGERGRTAALRDFIAAHRGYNYIDRYLPPEDQTQQPVGDDTIASIENNQLEKGEMVIVSPDNNHAVHTQRHLERLKQLAQAFTEAEGVAREQGSQTASIDAENFGQYSLEEVDIAFQTLGPHFVRHLLYLQQDPTRRELAQSLSAQWAILANFGDKIANNAQEHRSKKLRDMQSQEQELDKLDMEERVKMREVEVDAKIKMQKLIADIQRGATRDQLQYLIQRQKVSFDNELKRAETTAKIAQQAQQTTQEQVSGRNATELY